MSSFQIPSKELTDGGVDVEKFSKLLTVIGCPPEGTDLSRVILHLISASSAARVADSSPALRELADLTQSLWEVTHLLPRHEAPEDANPMAGRYADYPLYSLFAQRSTNRDEYWTRRVDFIEGLVLAAAWISDSPISDDYDDFLEELRVIKRDGKLNPVLSAVTNAGTPARIINSFCSNSPDILKRSFRKLAIRISEAIPPKQSVFPSLDDVESRLLGDAEEGEARVSTFREILAVIGFYTPSAAQLYFIALNLEPLIAIAAMLDSRVTDVWDRWSMALSSARNILNDCLPDPTLSSKDADELNAGELIAALTAKCERKDVASGLLVAKSVLLIGLFSKYDTARSDGRLEQMWGNYRRSAERDLAVKIAKCYFSEKSVYLDAAKQFLPAWPCSQPSQWKEDFLAKAEDIPADKSYRDQYGYHRDRYAFIRTIRRILNQVSIDSDQPPPPTQKGSPHTYPSLPPSGHQHTTIVAMPPAAPGSRPGRTSPSKPPFNLFHQPQEHPEAVSAALEPEALRVIPQQDTRSDQPVQPAYIQSLDVRYTNYRTAMDNQRLPWAWDCLNPFEITALTSALRESAGLEKASKLEKQGAFLVWLLLITGQTIADILQIGLGGAPNTRAALLAGPTYRRTIYPPPYAYSPTEQQADVLAGNTIHVDLPLPAPFPRLIDELGLTTPKVKQKHQHHRIHDYLGVNERDAEKAAREFLEAHRTRSVRLLPGRIRNVLGTEIMRVSNDPIATHHLAALPTDMPPSGVYYTSYSADHLERIYVAAVARIFEGTT